MDAWEGYGSYDALLDALIIVIGRSAFSPLSFFPSFQSLISQSQPV